MSQSLHPPQSSHCYKRTPAKELLLIKVAKFEQGFIGGAGGQGDMLPWICENL